MIDVITKKAPDGAEGWRKIVAARSRGEVRVSPAPRLSPSLMLPEPDLLGNTTRFVSFCLLLIVCHLPTMVTIPLYIIAQAIAQAASCQSQADLSSCDSTDLFPSTNDICLW